MQISKMRDFWKNSEKISLDNEEQVETVVLLSHKKA